MNRPIYASMRSMEAQKGTAFMDAFYHQRQLVEKVAMLETEDALLAKRALSSMMLFRMGVVSGEHLMRILHALADQGKFDAENFNGHRFDICSKEDGDALQELIRQNLWMVEVGIA